MQMRSRRRLLVTPHHWARETGHDAVTKTASISAEMTRAAIIAPTALVEKEAPLAAGPLVALESCT